MACYSCGVTKSRTVTLIMTAMSVILQLIAVILPKWSEIDTFYYGSPIKAHQNLWSVTVVTDKFAAFPSQDSMEIDWKKDIQKIEITCMVAGLLSLFLMLLSSICHKIHILSGVCHCLGIVFSVVAGLEVVIGGLLYKYQQDKIFSYKAKDPSQGYPISELKVSSAFYISVVAGCLFGCVAVFEIGLLVVQNVNFKRKENAVTHVSIK